MTLIDFDKKELLDISHALLRYRTDSTVIREEETEPVNYYQGA